MKSYALTGTETISSIISSYPTPTIANNVLSDGLGYLASGFDNSMDWDLQFEYKMSGNGNGFLLLPSGITARDKFLVQIWERSLLTFKNPNSTVTGGERFTAIESDTWADIRITKQTNTLTVYVNETQVGQATISTLSDYNTLYVGLDCMNRNNGHASIKDIRIKPL